MTSVELRTIRALLALLLDDSPTVVAAARLKLESLGPEGEKTLRLAAADDDARIRVRARKVLGDIKRREVGVRIEEFARLPDEELDLETGAFLLAQVEYPTLDPIPYIAILDALGEQLRMRVTSRHPPYAVVLELSRLISHEWRMRGNEEEFDDPDNSFIHRVLDRRKGIPISLAAIYLFAARRADLPLHGIGAPGHFLLRYGGAEWDLFIDPVTGRRIALEDAVRMLTSRGTMVSHEHFVPTSVRDMLVRMCANLVSATKRRRQTAATARWIRIRDTMRGSTV